MPDKTYTAELKYEAVRLALQQRHPPIGLLHHTDRGCQYTSTAYQALMAEKGVIVSMSRTGNCWDNTATESFFGTLKGECVDLVCFQTRTEARQTVFGFVEVTTIGFGSILHWL